MPQQNMQNRAHKLIALVLAHLCGCVHSLLDRAVRIDSGNVHVGVILDVDAFIGDAAIHEGLFTCAVT